MSVHVAIRTCVGCGQRAPQTMLLRVAAVEARLRIDPARRLPGRGAYLHQAPSCWTAFVRRRGPVRSLRMTPPLAERERLVRLLAGDESPSRGDA